MRKKPLFSITYAVAMLVLAQIPFAFGAWVAVIDAPEQPGNYTIVTRARYQGEVEDYPIPLKVFTLALSSSELVVTPMPQTDTIPPITLNFKISVGDQPLTSLSGSNVSAVFERLKERIWYGLPLEPAQFGAITRVPEPEEGPQGIFSTELDVPFEGEYTATINVKALSGGEVYTGTFETEFFASTASPGLDFEPFISDKVFTPGERFSASAALRFDGQELEDLDILEVSLDGIRHTLKWQDAEKIYRTTLSAPSEEAIYLMSLYASGQDQRADSFVYVVDLEEPQAEMCPITATNAMCDSATEARRCFAEYRDEMGYFTEEQLIRCITSSGFRIDIDFKCQSGAVGDLNLNGELDDADLAIMSSQILYDSDPIERSKFIQCADYDRDGDVDEDDFTCMSKVKSGDWWGDVGGGLCADIELRSPAKGDLNYDRYIDLVDLRLMDLIVNATTKGVTPTPDLLSFVDFDQDGRITSKDKECLTFFGGLNLDVTEGFLFDEMIPSECIRVYKMNECKKGRGDLNGDTVIDETDEILVMMASRRFVSPSIVDIRCADVNKDGEVTREDELCVKSYVSGDRDKFYVCLNCEDSIPSQFLSPYEICGDGWDNDCDGLIDRTSMDPALDECTCGEHTSCERRYSPVGGVTDLPDVEFYVCRKVSWLPLGYHWMPVVPCGASRICETSECAGTKKTCTYDGESWEWRTTLPLETDDPDDLPRTCSDGFDNDCNAGDQKCKIEEGGWLFTVLLITIIVVIVVAAIFAGPILAALANVLPAFLGGGAAGVAAGGAASIAMGTAMTAAEVAYMATVATVMTAAAGGAAYGIGHAAGMETGFRETEHYE